jgi:hypothetical protein
MKDDTDSEVRLECDLCSEFLGMVGSDYKSYNPYTLCPVCYEGDLKEVEAQNSKTLNKPN